eukprot:880766-Alexandrium_andersonii.AAC.1
MGSFSTSSPGRLRPSWPSAARAPEPSTVGSSPLAHPPPRALWMGGHPYGGPRLQAHGQPHDGHRGLPAR